MAVFIPSGKPSGEGGFTYLGVLFLIMVMGMGLASAGQLWSTAARRNSERQLLWVGTQYAQALRSYYRASPGLAQYPKALEDLLRTSVFPTPNTISASSIQTRSEAASGPCSAVSTVVSRGSAAPLPSSRSSRRTFPASGRTSTAWPVTRTGSLWPKKPFSTVPHSGPRGSPAACRGCSHERSHIGRRGHGSVNAAFCCQGRRRNARFYRG